MGTGSTNSWSILTVIGVSRLSSATAKPPRMNSLTVVASPTSGTASRSKVVGEGSPKALSGSDSAWVNQFMGGLPDGPVPFDYPAPDCRSDLIGESPA